MAQRFVRIVLCFLVLLAFKMQAQDDGVKSPNYDDYKSDTSYTGFKGSRFKVAYAQINALKNGGALFVRLKTNSKTIEKLRVAGNIDLATQVENETYLKNKIIMASYKKEFKFCPVYFFYSSETDSVKQKKLTNIFLDSSLTKNPSILCKASFYLIAEEDDLYNSSLGIVSESDAPNAVERGNATRTAFIVVKNRYFIQLHKPFPYFQLKGDFINRDDEPLNRKDYLDLPTLYYQFIKTTNNSAEWRRLKSLRGAVRILNEHFDDFYKKNPGYPITPDISEFVY